MAIHEMFRYCLALTLFLYCIALPEQGLWEETLKVDKQGKLLVLTKSMFNDSTVRVRIGCKESQSTITVSWLLRWTPCAEEYFGIETIEKRYSYYLTKPAFDQIGMGYQRVYFIRYNEKPECKNGFLQLKEWDADWEVAESDSPEQAETNERNKDPAKVTGGAAPVPTAPGQKTTGPQTANATGAKEGSNRRRRDVTGPLPKNKANKTAGDSPEQAETNERNKDTAKVTGGAAPVPTAPGQKTTGPQTANATGAKEGSNRRRRDVTGPLPKNKANKTAGNMHKDTRGGRLPVLATTDRDGIFLFILKIETTEGEEQFDVKVAMMSKSGYLSAIEWPFLPFYGIMCMVYVVYGLVWLVLSICNWKDLLRIQFWIGGVIFLGMLEKAVFFAEYESINKTGQSVRGAVVLAELVSCLKRTLARMLVVIVSIGFGIVKPRLGPAFHRVLGAGALYFILASIEGCLRELKPKGDNSNQTMLASIPLAVLDAAICWWVFTSLVQTTRTLRLRRNLVKLSLYRHFTNTLVIAVLASVAYMIWSIKMHKLVKCMTDWKELWVDEAFWHILFSVILLVIMVLWRPSINNQRYAFSPLLDAADEEAEEPMMSDAYDGMKMRGGKPDAEFTKKPKDAQNKAEEDLKWIEENIPASVADTALPSLLDSDEEVMTTKYEMSKME